MLRIVLVAAFCMLHGQAGAQSAPATAVAVKPLAEVAVHPVREAAAEVVALNESRIAAEIAGRIEVIAVEAGQTIARGALVARLDCRDHELARARAEAALEAGRARAALAQQQLERARALKAKGFFSTEALAARETETRVLESDVAQARAQLDGAARAVGKCAVHAPFAAIVRQRLGQVGELAVPGTPLATLIDTGRIELSARVQAQDADSLRAAKSIRFSGETQGFEVALLRLSPAIDRASRTIEVRLRFSGESAPPGAQGRIQWREDRPHLPPALVVRRGGRLGVFLERGGLARFHPLPQAQEGRPAPADVPPDARVVVAGHLGLRDGAPLAPGTGTK